MIYLDIKDNIRQIIRTFDVVEYGQLVRFFVDENHDEKSIRNLLDYLIRTNFFRLTRYKEGQRNDKDKISGNRLLYTSGVVNNLIKLFWVPVSLKADNIQTIIVSNTYPTQITFVTADNVVYDVTYCSDVKDAVLTKSLREKSRIKGVKDEIYHMAMVENEYIKEEIKQCGFDGYCILSPNNVPIYYNF